jgi:hypothetical protein
MSKVSTKQWFSGVVRPAPFALTALASALLLTACGGGGEAPAPSQLKAETSLSPVPASATTTPPASTAPSSTATASAPVATASAPTATTATATTDALPTDAIFAPTSFWYTPLPASVPLHANTAGFVAEFLRQKAAYYGTVNINTWSYASPVYTAQADTPTNKVAYSNCQRKIYGEPGLEAQWTNVPMPSEAAPADGTDAEMTVRQPSTDSLWEFWVTKNVNGQWQACWGGKMSNVSTSNGIWPFPYGTTATGLPFIGGQITAEELARGEIRHVIGISLVEAEAASILSWPANRSDGFNPLGAPNRIPEGLRFRLDPTIQVDTLPMTTAGKIIARAAQKYGFVVWDKAGSISLRAQNPKTYAAMGQANPYPALFSGKPSYLVLDGFPWNKLQFLPMNYGKP